MTVGSLKNKKIKKYLDGMYLCRTQKSTKLATWEGSFDDPHIHIPLIGTPRDVSFLLGEGRFCHHMYNHRHMQKRIFNFFFSLYKQRTLAQTS